MKLRPERPGGLFEGCNVDLNWDREGDTRVEELR